MTQALRFGDAFSNWTQAKAGDACKTVMYTVDWGKHLGYFDNHSSTALKIRSTAAIGKLVFSGPLELPKKLTTLGDKIVDFCEKPSFSALAQIFWKTNATVAPVVDTIELGVERGIIYLDSDTMKTCKWINGVSLVLGMTNDAIDAFINIVTTRVNDSASPQLQKWSSDILFDQMIKLAKSISYVALGVFIVLSIFFEVAVPGLYFLTAATSALAFSILGYFYEEIGQPKLERKKAI